MNAYQFLGITERSNPNEIRKAYFGRVGQLQSQSKLNSKLLRHLRMAYDLVIDQKNRRLATAVYFQIA